MSKLNIKLPSPEGTSRSVSVENEDKLITKTIVVGDTSYTTTSPTTYILTAEKKAIIQQVNNKKIPDGYVTFLTEPDVVYICPSEVVVSIQGDLTTAGAIAEAQYMITNKEYARSVVFLLEKDNTIQLN